MPFAPKKPCKDPRCSALTESASGFCPTHQSQSPPMFTDRKQPSKLHMVNYAEWRRVRARVLRDHGIPRSQWSAYDVDHEPPFDPERDPDHSHYKLTPRLHADHAAKTARFDGGFGNKKRVGGSKSL
jgi:5-methylcytosine-specific restriction enzyme A